MLAGYITYMIEAGLLTTMITKAMWEMMEKTTENTSDILTGLSEEAMDDLFNDIRSGF